MATSGPVALQDGEWAPQPCAVVPVTSEDDSLIYKHACLEYFVLANITDPDKPKLLTDDMDRMIEDHLKEMSGYVDDTSTVVRKRRRVK